MDRPLNSCDTTDHLAVRAWLEAGAAVYPDKLLFRSIEQGRDASYAATRATARRMSRFLAARGFRANDRVALLSNNSLEHLMVYYGVIYHGATICTIHVEMNAIVIDELLNGLAPKLVLYEEGIGLEAAAAACACEVLSLGEFFIALARESDEAPGPPVNGPDDIAAIFYTSGTTSAPKGVPCTFRELDANVRAVTESFGIGAADTILDYRSFNWMSAQTLSALGALCRGATLAMARKFSRTRLFDWICDCRATVVAGNPTVINMLNTAPIDISRAEVPWLRFFTSSSAPLLVADWRSFEERYGIPVVQGFGSSETGWIAAASMSAVRRGSVGKPFAYHDLAIVDSEGRRLPARAVGFVELGPGGDWPFRYLEPDGSIVAHAWGRYRTGDLGYLDDDGFLYLTGREKDLIIRGGVNISPVEIDNVLNLMDGIAEAACVGVPDSIYGEEVVAFVVPRDGIALSEDAVLAHCRGRLAEAKMPKRVMFRDRLPKTDRGKLDRKALAGLPV